MSTIEISNDQARTIIRGEHFTAYRNGDGSWDLGQNGLEWKYSITIYPGELGELQHILKAMGIGL